MKRKRMTPMRALKLARRRITCCVLCHSPAVERLGCFLPARPEHWVGPPVPREKERSFWYGVCGGYTVLGLDEVGRRVERLLSAPLN
jgi:hypothetical protein